MADEKHIVSKHMTNDGNDDTFITDPVKMKSACIKLLSELIEKSENKNRVELQHLLDNIENCTDPDELSNYFTRTFDIAKLHLKLDRHENSEISEFLLTIVNMLSDLEKELVSTLETGTKPSETASSSGTDSTSGTKKVPGSKDSITELDNFKALISSKLETIKESVENKFQEYFKRYDKSRKEYEHIQEKLTKLIAEIREKDKILEKQVRIDPIIGIFNRRVFEETVTTVFENYSRYNTPFSLIFFDIDNFKRTNDQYGHETGDRVLKIIGAKVSNMIRGTDVFARYGGEEFVIILPETDVIQGINVANKIQHGIEEITVKYKNSRVHVTISAGVTEIKESDGSYQSTVNRADEYMYIAKKKGRNQIVSDIDVLIENTA